MANTASLSFHQSDEEHDPVALNQGTEVEVEEQTEMEYEEEEYEEEPRSGRGWVIASVILLLAVGASGYGNYHFFTKAKNFQEEKFAESARADSIKSVQWKIEKEIAQANATIEELMRYKTESESLRTDLEEAARKIKGLQASYRQLQRQGGSAKLSEYEQKLDEATKENQEVQEKYATLVSELDRLRSENAGLRDSLSAVLTKEQAMQTQMSAAAGLKFYSVITESTEEKRGEYVFTSKAKRVDRFSVSFVISENKLAEKGPRQVYLLITDPKGTMLIGEEDGVFYNKSKREESRFTRHKEVNYTGQSEKIFFNWEGSAKYYTGNYNFELYLDGELMATSKVTLR
ncbi:hypothetical protein SAMN05421823_104403 [Catalinimonas alkaloidigena]|uniref:Uncharacterized protein n=1 Tax=Catalinimonas alkaloidigena TaxID=1075417 RepID=A0A1G9HDZ0_9BACT|nr:hypothetical protein [Catalinimonas alkaloidigena]SDL11072.1 hypothetical protein SAMN05421823_104403 [Catalinimonas alkaloidigena]